MAHVVINGLFLSKRNTGGGRYVSDLAGELTCPDNRYTLLVNGAQPLEAFSGNRQVKAVSCGFFTSIRPTRVLWERTCLANVLDKMGCDLFHACGFTLPPSLRQGMKTVLTIFDMTFFKMPEVHEAAKLAYFTARIPDSIRRADAVIAISHQTRQDILSYVKVPADKIHVVPLGYRPFLCAGELDEVSVRERCRELGLPEEYILFVGTIEPRKNLIRLIEAYRSLLRRGIRHKLVLVGKKGWHYNNILRSAYQNDVRGRIIVQGYVPDQDMPAVYRGASLFAYPSLYEGFGIPVLEAMSCGIPVVTSSVSSLPEIVRDAGLLVDPHDTDAIASAMERVLTDKQLRISLKEKGARRAQSFSLRRMAEETERIYSMVLEQ